MLFVVLCPGIPKGSTGSGSGFKASQKTVQQLKVSSDRLGEAGNRTCDPWFTRHRFIPYTTAASSFSYIHVHVYDKQFGFCIIFRTKSKINIKKILINIAIKLLIDRIEGEHAT